jgi:hypothetical protein
LAIFTTEITYMPKVRSIRRPRRLLPLWDRHIETRLKIRRLRRLLISLDATPPNYWERDTRCVDGIWENKVKPNSKIKTKLPSPGTVGPWLIRTEPWNSRLLSTPYLVLRTSTSIFTFDVVRARITHTGQGESPEWQIISPDLGIPPVLQFITEHQNRSKSKPTLKEAARHPTCSKKPKKGTSRF